MLVVPYLYISKPAAEADPFVGVDACSVNFAYFSLGAEFLETVVISRGEGDRLFLSPPAGAHAMITLPVTFRRS